MSRFILLLLLALVAFVPLASARPQQSAASIEAFALGLLEGMEEEFSGNMAQCLQDEEQAAASFQVAMADLQTGWARKSVSLVEQALVELGVALNDAAASLKDCNVTAAVADIEKVAKMLSEGEGGIIEVVIKETVGFFTRKGEITGVFKTLLGAWKAAQWQQAGEAAGKLVAILLQDA